MVPPLSPDRLRWTAPADALPFEHTGQLEPSEEIVGQDRALAALALGVKMENPGYNVFVCGLSGGGRLRTLARIVQGMAPRRRSRRDLVFVQGLEDPSRPRLVSLSSRTGARFREDLAELRRTLYDEIPRILDSDPVRRRRDTLLRTQDRDEWQRVSVVQEAVTAAGFAIVEEQFGDELRFSLGFLVDGEAATRSDVRRLAREGKLGADLDELEARFDDFEDQLAAVVGAARQRMQATAREVDQAERDAVREQIAPHFAVLQRRYRTARSWLRDLHERVTRRLDLFRLGAPEAGEAGPELPPDPLLRAFHVNVFHRGSRERTAPVVIAPDPTFRNLFGGIELMALGAGGFPTVPDHTHLRAGSLHDADGGLLIVNADDLLVEPEVWKTLKRAMMFGELGVRNPESVGGAAAPPLRPDLVPLDVKVVVLGSPGLYQALYYNDPDFEHIFKVKVEFEAVGDYSPDIPLRIARFLARMASREGFRPLHRDAVAEIVRFAVRESGRGGRILLSFGALAGGAREAEIYASGETIGAEAVLAALRARAETRGGVARRYLDAVMRDVILARTDGAVVGQVNGLAVVRAGGTTFGRPLRVTATVGTGRGGLSSIEREVGLAGKSLDKGMRVLSGFLRARFSRVRTMAVTGAISIEQNYGFIDGDSATAAQLFALLSSISGVPVEQGRAITGSVDQLGNIQPVGGVNEKIEGFFAVCQARGLNGAQGVVIPDRNAQDLCLDAAVVEACAAGQFHIWPIRTVEEGLALLMGVEVGDAQAEDWPVDTVYGRVAATLEALEAVVRRASKGPDKKADGQDTESGEPPGKPLKKRRPAKGDPDPKEHPGPRDDPNPKDAPVPEVPREDRDSKGDRSDPNSDGSG